MQKRRTRNNSSTMVDAAREMRRYPTPAEDKLWGYLRDHRFGVKWRRQHPVGRYILDFWCPAARLVIELDGGVHEHHAERDAERTAVLEAANHHVIRFRNEEVMKDVQSVLARVWAEVEARGVVLPPLPPLGRGGPGG